MDEWTKQYMRDAVRSGIGSYIHFVVWFYDALYNCSKVIDLQLP